MLAKEKRGKCISTEFMNIDSKLLWSCSNEDHPPWEATPYNIKNGSWCPKCVGKNKTIEDMHEIAEERGGKCLSSEYKGMHNRLLWKCAVDEHPPWKATPSSVLNNNSWCLVCSGSAKKTIADMNALAERYGGKCLSSEYVNNNTDLLWKCSNEDHPPWKAKPRFISSGRWCKECAKIR